MIQKIYLILLFLTLGLSYQAGKEYIFELHAKICPKSHKALLAGNGTGNERIAREIVARSLCGKSKIQVISRLGIPIKTKIIDADPLIFGHTPKSFLKGDEELYFNSPEVVACIRNNQCIASRVEFHGKYKSATVFE